MDVMMPNKDGVEVCREIMEFAPATRVVMLTASTEEDAMIGAVAAGELRVPTEVVRRVFAGVRA